MCKPTIATYMYLWFVSEIKYSRVKNVSILSIRAFLLLVGETIRDHGVNEVSKLLLLPS